MAKASRSEYLEITLPELLDYSSPGPNYSLTHPAAVRVYVANERANPRLDLKIPIRVRNLDQEDSVEHALMASNVSAGGIFFRTAGHLKMGTLVRIFLIMPVEIFGKPVLRWGCSGRVVHTHQYDLSETNLGGGVSFLKCTALSDESPAGFES
jgi:hypothetical protein